MERERRFIPGAEARAKDDGKTRRLEGLAALFNTPTKINTGSRGFVERIAPGAFDDVVDDPNTMILFNHSASLVLGRNGGSASISTTDKGLNYNVDLDDTTIANDVYRFVKRGDVRGNSFAFTVADGGEEWDEDADPPIRTITKVARLFDCGPVVYPSYAETTVSARAERRAKPNKVESVADARRVLADLGDADPPDLLSVDEARRKIQERESGRRGEARSHKVRARVLADLDREDETRWITCLHEAAHAVIGILDDKRVRRLSVWSDGGRIRGATSFEDPEHVGRDVHLAGLAVERVFNGGPYRDPDAVASSRADLIRANCNTAETPAGLPLVEDRVRAYRGAIETLARALERAGSLDGPEAEKIAYEALGPTVRRKLIERRAHHRRVAEQAALSALG